jgi:hypothetical protein
VVNLYRLHCWRAGRRYFLRRAEVRPLLGRNGLPPETTVVYRELLAERMRLCGQLEVAEIAILSGTSARVSWHA